MLVPDPILDRPTRRVLIIILRQLVLDLVQVKTGQMDVGGTGRRGAFKHPGVTLAENAVILLSQNIFQYDREIFFIIKILCLSI